MHHPPLFAKRAEKQGSLNWLTAPTIVNYELWLNNDSNSSFAAGCMRNLLPGSAPVSLQWFSLYLSFSIICKATTVTHTKRIDRNLLRKETSFVCYTSSVLIQIENRSINRRTGVLLGSNGNVDSNRWRQGQSPSRKSWSSTNCKVLLSVDGVFLPLFLLR